MSQTKAQLLDNIKDNVQLDARNSLRFADTDSSHYVAFKAPATVSNNVTWTLPAADGSANYVLATDGSGTLSWIADPAGQWTTSGSNIYFTGGNVGIGDSSPSNPLSVTGASVFDGDLTLTGSSYNVVWDKSDNALEFADNAKAVFGAGSDLEVYHSGSHSVIKNGTGYLQLVTDSFTVNNNANDENIITALANGEVRLYFDNGEKLNTVTDGVNITGSLQFGDDTNTYLQRSAADTLQIVTGGTAALTVDASQEVGIGTTGPTTILDVRDTSTTSYPFASADSGVYSYTPYAHELNLRNNTTGTTDGFAGIHFHAGERSAGGRQGTARISALYTGEYKADLVFATRNTSFAERMRITAAGKVGIGTTSPDAPLTIHNSSDPEIRFGYSASQDHRIAWDSSKIYIHADPDNANGSSALALAVDGTTALTINDDQDVGIGVTPAIRLDVGDSNAVAWSTSQLGCQGRIQNTATTDGSAAGLQLRVNNAAGAAAIQYIFAVGTTTNYKSDLVFATRTAASTYQEKLRVKNGGDVEITDGNLVVASGHGIDFSATGDGSGNSQDEVFTDYEKGRWVPTANDGCDGFTYTASRCVYTLVGKKVTIWARIVNPTNVDSGTFEIGGLPFTPADHTVGTGMFNSFAITTTRTNGTAQLNPFVVAAGYNVIRLYFSGLVGNDTWTAIPGDYVTSNGDMYLHMSYWIA